MFPALSGAAMSIPSSALCVFLLLWPCLDLAAAEVRIHPGRATVAAGAACQFSAALVPPAPAAWCWTVQGGLGAIDPQTGLFRAPRVAQAGSVKVRATLAADSLVWAEATVVVVPEAHPALDLVSAVMGGDWAESWSRALPFLDLESGKRFGPGVRVAGETWGPSLHAGLGLPVTLAWEPAPGAAGRLLSYSQGDEVVRLDVTRQDSQEIVPRGRVDVCILETLYPLGSDGFRSEVETFQINVRGLAHLAGNPIAEGGHQDGRGLGARFRQPFGLARLPGPRVAAGLEWLVTDRESHTLRRLTLDGEVATLAGEPGTAGHRDSPGLLSLGAHWLRGTQPPGPLFSGPTYVVARRHPRFMPWQGCWQALVADSGNHCIRAVDWDGTVTTVAGVPGQPGHRDGGAATALFRDPRGLALDAAGVLYIADRGNRVIRRLDQGVVGTLAGAPGAAGLQDGPGPAARFTDLRGLACEDRHGTEPALFALDGHALRRVAVPDGSTTTVLGSVAQSGFLDFAAEDGPADLRRPCLNDPTGVSLGRDGVLIADHGNHALRCFDPVDETLTTLVGGPELPGTRWGLPREGLRTAPDGRFAGLDGPWTAEPTGNGSVLITSGRCLAEANLHPEPHEDLELEVEPRIWARGLSLRPLLAAWAGLSAGRPVHYRVDFLDAGGEVLERREGTVRTGDTVDLAPTGARAEDAVRAVVRAVTGEGFAAAREVALPEQAPAR